MAFIINGERIEDSVLEEEFDSIKDHYQSMGEVVCCDRDQEFWDYARDNVINRTLMEQESISRFGDISDDEVTARFEALKEEHGGEQNFYDNTGFNLGDAQVIRRKIRSSMLVDRLLEEELKEEAEPTEEELEAYYQENINRYMSKEEVRVSQIFIEPSSHDAAQEAYAALREVRGQILDGKDFDEAAREHGIDEDRDIDLGWMRQGETMPEIEAITFSLRVGEVSPIVATHYGFHVFKLTDRKDPAPIPRQEIEGLVEQFAVDRRNREVESVIEKLREKSTIEEVTAETGERE